MMNIRSIEKWAKWLGIILLGLILAFANRCYAVQLPVPNGDFLSNLSHWDTVMWNTSGVVFSWVGSDGHNAVGCGKATHSQSDGHYGFSKRESYQVIPVTSGKTVVFSAWVKCQGDCDVWLTGIPKSSDYTILSEHSTRPIEPTDWSCLELVLKIPADGVYLRIDIRGSGVGSFWVDDVTVEELSGAELENYFVDYYNLDFEEIEQSWAKSWPGVAWPVDDSSVGPTTDAPHSGSYCLAFSLGGSEPRGVALNFDNLVAMPLDSDFTSVEITSKTAGPDVSLLVNYYEGAFRQAIEEFELSSSPTWATTYCVLNPPTGADGMQLEIVAEGAGCAWVDGLTPKVTTGTPTVTGISVPLLYPDGYGIPPAQFNEVNGTPNQSYEPLATPTQQSVADALEEFRYIHPRLIFRSVDISTLRSWALGTHSDMYDWLMDGVRWQFQNPIGGRRSYGNAAILYSLAYVLNEDSAILHEAKHWLFGMCDQYWMPGDLEYKHSVAGLALGYDWLLGTFTARERDEIRLKLAVFSKPWYDLAVDEGINAAWQQNHTSIGTVAYGLAGMALYGDGNPYGGNSASLAWAEQARWGMGNVIETLPPDGTSHEGLLYWSYGTDWLIKYIECHRRLAGEDLFASDAWFSLMPLFRLHLTTADWQYQSNFANCRIDETTTYYPAVMRLGARESLDYGAVSNWMADRTNEMTPDYQLIGQAEDIEKRAWEFLFYDPRVEPIPPADAQIPTWHHFDDLDVAVARSDWSEDGTLFVFKCGPYAGHEGAQWYEAGAGSYDCVWGHNNPDAGSFQLFHRGIPLAVDIGYTQVNRTHNHNTIMPGSYGQVGDGETWTFSTVPYSQAPHISKFFGSPGLFYAKGDAGDFYQSGSALTQFDREIIGIDGEWFVIVDDLASSSGREFRWLLNSRKAGSIDGNTITIEDDGGPVATGWYDDVWGTTGQVHPDGPSFLVVNFLEPDGLNISGDMENVESPIVTFDQVWRLEAKTPSVLSANFIVVLTPLASGETVPTVQWNGSNEIIIDDGQERARVQLSDGAITMAKWLDDRLISVGAVGVNEVEVDGQVYQGDGGAIDWCHVFCGHKSIEYLPSDVNLDCYVNLKDFAQLASRWLFCTDPVEIECDQYWKD